MKQKTSFFNWGLSRNILKRTWVLWVAYLALMLSVTLGSLPKVRTKDIIVLFDYTVGYNFSVMNLGISAAQINVFAGVAAAMAVYSYMYSSRTCGMINALPIRRETAFITSYLTGLGMLVITDLICVISVWIAAAQTGFLFMQSIWTLLGYTVLSAVAFYSFASFCAVLTGNVFVLPAVYVVLGVTAYVVIASVGELLSDIVYGMDSDYLYNGNVDTVYWLSPIIYILYTRLDVNRITVFNDKGEAQYTGEFEITGLGTLGVYCAIGLALFVCAVLIYRRRDMERAGDVVAVPILMPVFKYCMTFGAAVVCALVVYHNVLTDVTPGLITALVIAALLILGAAIGYYAAEMLMQKTLKVFKTKCTGLIISCALLAAFALAAEFDAIGFEAYVPASEDVIKAEVALGGYDTVFEEGENLAAITKLHESIIAEKDINEAAEYRRYVDLTYTLSDGSTVRRAYKISDDNAQKLDASSGVTKAEALLATQEAKDYYLAFEGKDYEVSASTVDSSSLDGYVVYPDENGGDSKYDSMALELTPAQAAELYECIVLDSKDSSLGARWLITDEEFYNTVSNVSFYLQLKRQMNEENGYPYYPYLSVEITLDAARTLAWLAENTDIEPMSLAEADPETAEETLQDLKAVQTHSRKSAVGIIGGADGPTAIYVSH